MAIPLPLVTIYFLNPLKQVLQRMSHVAPCVLLEWHRKGRQIGHPDHSWMKINIFRHIVTSCIHSLSWDTGQGANLSTIFGLLGLICATNMGKALLTAGLPSQPPKDPLSLAGECVYLGMNFVPYGLQVCHHLNLSSSTFFKLPFLCPVFLFSSSSHRNAAVPHRLK